MEHGQPHMKLRLAAYLRVRVGGASRRRAVPLRRDEQKQALGRREGVLTIARWWWGALIDVSPAAAGGAGQRKREEKNNDVYVTIDVDDELACCLPSPALRNDMEFSAAVDRDDESASLSTIGATEPSDKVATAPATATEPPEPPVATPISNTLRVVPVPVLTDNYACVRHALFRIGALHALVDASFRIGALRRGRRGRGTRERK